MDRLQGADPTTLENKIQQYYGSEESEDAEGVAGHVSIHNIFIALIKYIKLILDGPTAVYNKSPM